MAALRIAAIGSVNIHDIKIPDTTRRFASLVINRSNSEPTDTCVVAPQPNRLAIITSVEVTRFAGNPAPIQRRNSLVIVIATFRAFNKPPIAIATATNNIPNFTSNVLITSRRATIFGVSFNPRAKPTLPALRK